jgi:O-methyltransferase
MIRFLSSVFGRQDVAQPAETDTGGELVRVGRDEIVVGHHLCPSGHKLYDFREEPDFAGIAAATRKERRTYLRHNRLLTLWQAVRNTRGLRGELAEVGTWRGGSARFLAASSRHFGELPEIHAFDTFEGHPDVIEPGIDGAHAAGNFANTSFEEVREYLAPYPNVILHKGEFRKTREAVADREFRLAHIDVDLYKSTVDGLEFFWPRLCEGGVMVVDDYGFTSCKGAKKAVDEFLGETDDAAGWYLHTGQFVVEKRSVARR